MIRPDFGAKLKTEARIPKKPTSNKAVVVDIARRPVTAFIDDKLKESWITIEGMPDTINIKHVSDPEFTETKVRISGILDTENGGDIPSPQVISELVPYLETKIDAKIVTIKGINFQIMKQISQDIMNGKAISFKELVETNGFIIATGAHGGTTAVLSSNEDIISTRSIFVFVNKDQANKALLALKSFPPYKKDYFYEKATVCTLADVDTQDLITEKFLYFDIWQKAVANCSAHMSIGDK